MVNSTLGNLEYKTLKTHDSGNVELWFTVLGGRVYAGQTALLGNLSSLIPEGYSLGSAYFTPQANTPILMMALGADVYAYSKDYSGDFNYNAILVINKI